MELIYICEKEMLLKEYLVYLGLSRRFCKRVKLYGKMMINDEIALNFYPVHVGDKITLEYNEEINEEILTLKNDLDIVYEDSHILVVNKMANLATQPSRKHFECNLVSMVKGYFEKNGINSNVHVVNRLDYATSGLMVIAKDGFTHFALTKEKIINRYYYAVIHGIMDRKEGIIDLPIARSSSESIKREVNSNGKQAITHYKVVKEDVNNNTSVVKIKLDTGRTHQIRVHFSYLGYPLVGDALYNPEYNDEERLYLHSYKVEFIHPYTNELISLEKEPDFL
ncbi:MAG: RluA family pseudouridine synthase [Bacilli bacterium]|nr:RluA family pseudouridine synthase [Bacilli bacterium]